MTIPKITPEQFDEWAAETVMGWSDEGYWWVCKNGDTRPQERWHPSRDLNQMREVEMVVGHLSIGIAAGYGKALKLDGDTSLGPLSDFGIATASCEQRMAAIIKIKEEIERAVNAKRYTQNHA